MATEREKFTAGQLRLIAGIAACFVLLTTLAVITGANGARTEGTAQGGGSPLRLSEYMSSNRAIPDGAGNCSDWVEITNAGDKPVDMSGYAVENGGKTGMLPKKSLEPGGYAVVYCDGGSPEGKPFGNAAFKLKAAGGEELRLLDPNGNAVDATRTIALESNVSAVRVEDAFVPAEHPTPGYPNTEEGYAAWQATRIVKQSDLLLNEIMADNTVTIPDADGKYADYIEIRNASDKTIALERYGLSNDGGDPLKWQFPARELKAGEVLLVFASGKGHSADKNELHAGFKINKAEDTVYLSSPDGRLLDSVEINGLESDTALSRQADGTWVRTAAVSPGQPNTSEGADRFWAAADKAKTGLLINEVMTRNNTITCINGRPTDWLEIVNPGGKPVSLKGYTLSNDPASPDLFALPDVTVPAGGYAVIYATGGGVAASGSRYIEAPFKLSGKGGMVALYKDGKMVDGVSLANIPIDASKGRRPGASGFWFFTKPTLGAANSGGAERDITAAPMAATKPGVYNGVGKLEVTLSGEGAIYYTLDGSEPTASSTRYTGPFALTATRAVRAIAVKKGAIPSDILTASYIIKEKHALDVVSVTSEPDGLFGQEKGIYAQGPKSGWENGNYMKRGYAWERAAHAELFPQAEGDEGFSLGCGLRIFGGMSRMYEKKSFSLQFRDSYGEGTLTYPVFASRDNRQYESLLLRSTGQDRLKAMMRDAMFTSLADGKMQVEVQAYRSVVLYLNGTYWGVYNIREQIDKYFIASHLNVSPGSVQILKANGMAGPGSEDYQALKKYIADHKPLDAAAYKYVADRMDVTSFIDYLIAEIYCANNDGGNIRFYRSSETDNKWRWILYDTDISFAHKADQIEYMTHTNGIGGAGVFSTAVVNGLLTNSDFRALFLERLELHMKDTFSTERVIARIDEFANRLRPEMKRNFTRWDKPDHDWEGAVEGLRAFAKKRQAVIRNELSSSPSVTAKFKYTAEQIAKCFE